MKHQEQEPTVGDGAQHVVFGAGNVGRALVDRLSAMGLAVRVVSRRQPPVLREGVEWRSADARDAAATTEASGGATVIYQCLNAPYSKWATQFPPLQRAVLAAAERHGALLVSLENLYGYGPTDGTPMNEDLPLVATTVKGRTRAAMTQELLDARDAGRVRIAIGRASDFFGAGVTDGSTLGERVFANALGGRRADFIGNPALLHTYSYVPDIARGLAILGTDDRAVDHVWHLPGPETVTTQKILELVATEIGHRVDSRSVPKLALRALGVFNPVLRSMVEMTYQFDQPFVLDTSRFESTFAETGTALHQAIATTVSWYRARSEPSVTDQIIGVSTAAFRSPHTARKDHDS
jgi:nucleoside-diphosphate-sugar epimerase